MTADLMTRGNERVPTLQKIYFVLSILAVPIGLGGIAGGVLIIINISGAVVAGCGATIVFISFCLTTIPIGTSLIIFHLRCKRAGDQLVITKSYTDLTKPSPRSFRSITGDNPSRTVGSTHRNPYTLPGEETSHSTAVPGMRYGEEPQTGNIASESNVTVKGDNESGSRDVTAINKNLKDSAASAYKNSPRLGKPVPVPVAPDKKSYDNQAYDSGNTSSSTGPFVKSSEAENNVPLSRDLSTQITSMPPRNKSSLYPPIHKYEEIGTKM